MTSYINYLAEAFFSEKPVIFEDSNPEQQDSYVYSYITSLRGSLHIAFTGQVPKFHEPGKLRLIWWLVGSGTQGMKDYELRQYEEVYDNFNKLRILPEVARCCILGYKSQNPYAATTQSRLLTDMLDKEIEKTRKERERTVGFGTKPSILDVEDLVKETEKQELERHYRDGEKREKVDV
ncbi:hypothetical protein BJ878DRAFT_492143 [Calycina marina]|uniref:Uncharacterized protein n=1 Tax=Calycina marina TaxID=1763456 RepID=A0A9P8CI24_9HELO|nr:hypothetical protein BJ878DRAFT_492143 [Calycina marina]